MNSLEISKLTEKYLKETDENIIGVSYGYKIKDGKVLNEKVISFTVKKKLPIDEIDKDKLLPKTIEYLGETFKTDVIEGEIKLMSTSFCYPEHYTWWEYWQPIPTIPSNRNKFRPIKGGISLTNYSSQPNTVGTLGFIAIDSNTNSFVGVTNNHVVIDDAFIASERASSVISNVKRDVATQPNETTDYGMNNRIGEVKRYVPIYENVSNKVDAALITIDESVMSLDESWKQEGLIISSPMPFATESEIDNLLGNGILLYSSGRRSGAKGELDTKIVPISVNSSCNISYSRQNVDVSTTFTDLITFMASGTTITSGDTCFFPLAAGDSGSALIAEINGVKKIVGLCFAGSYAYIPIDPEDPLSEQIPVCYNGLACRIDRVASELEIEAWTGQTNVNFSNTSNTEECIVTGKDSRSYIIKDGKKYWQFGLTLNNNICIPDS